MKLPVHMNIAMGEMGVSEIPGPEHNQRIIAYFTSTTYHASADEVPWCAAFVNWVLEQAGISRTKSAAALSFRDWGVRVDKPSYGDIAVINRGGGKGHVAFYTGEKVFDGQKYVSLLGGNQSDSVNIEWFKASDIEQYRATKSSGNSTTVKASVVGVSASIIGLGFQLVTGAMSAEDPVQYVVQNWEQIALVTTTLATAAYTWWDRSRKIGLYNN